MMYTEQELNRVVELFQGVEANKEHENAAPTYRDVPALKEMAEIMLANEENSAEVLEEKIPVFGYLAHSYDYMCRQAVAVKYYKLLVEAYAQLKEFRELTQEEMEQIEDVFYSAVRARNCYVKDDCEDLKILLKNILSEEAMEKIMEAVAERRRGLPKSDPVEMTEEYLAVIDEVEEKIEKNKKIDICFEYWDLKEKYLRERGIKWRSPSELNPGVMFD